MRFKSLESVSEIRQRMATTACAGIAIGAMSLALGLNVARVCLLGLALVPAVGIYLLQLRGRLALARKEARLVEEWGKVRDKKRDLTAQRAFYGLTANERFEPSAPLDDQTWADLNMDALYARIDRTYSVPGENLLYEMLRKPMLSAGALRQREEMIRGFERSAELRQSVQGILRDLGRNRGQGTAVALWNGLPPPSRWTPLFTVLALLALIALGSMAFFGAVAMARWVALLFLINMAVHYRVKNRVVRDGDTIKYLGLLVSAAAQLEALGHPELESLRQSLKVPVERTRSLATRSVLLLPELEGGGANVLAVLTEYISIYFLNEARAYEAILTKIRAHREELKSIYQRVGEIDALQAAASYRAGLASYASPEFEEGGEYLHMRDVKHPLIEDAVANSITISGHGIAITGSNMSGKTTFIRTLGVNVLLAQTVCACIASQYKGRILRVISSINDGDDLLAGKSYFMVEAERLLKMLRLSVDEETTLCLIDEPLAGTKSVDRHAALQEILRYLVGHNAIGVLCTHDVDLVAEMSDVFVSYHFGDEVNHAGIVSDFRLKGGLSYESNAIKLLAHLGYPEQIISRSQQRMSERARPHAAGAGFDPQTASNNGEK